MEYYRQAPLFDTDSTEGARCNVLFLTPTEADVISQASDKKFLGDDIYIQLLEDDVDKIADKVDEEATAAILSLLNKNILEIEGEIPTDDDLFSAYMQLSPEGIDIQKHLYGKSNEVVLSPRKVYVLDLYQP